MMKTRRLTPFATVCSCCALLVWAALALRPTDSASHPSAAPARPTKTVADRHHRVAPPRSPDTTSGIREELDKASRITPRENAVEAMQRICMWKAERDPAMAIQLAGEYGLFEKPGPLLENLVHCWAEADLPAALAWFQAQSLAETAKTACASRLAFAWAKSSGADAARFALEEIPPGEDQDEAIVSVLHQWMQHDPEASARWVSSFPESPLKLRAEAELNGLLGSAE